MEPLRSSPVLSVTVFTPWEKVVSDLIYLGAGVAVLLAFAGYAALLRRG